MRRSAGPSLVVLVLLVTGCSSGSLPGAPPDRARADVIEEVRVSDPPRWPPSGVEPIPAAQLDGSWSSTAPITAWLSDDGRSVFYADQYDGCGIMRTRAREDDETITVTEHLTDDDPYCAGSRATLRLHLRLARPLSGRHLSFTMA